MGFNKRFLPELDELIDFLHTNGSYAFYNRFIKKTDAFIGPAGSVEFIDKFMESYESKQNG